jgi:hypothetical protein
MDVSKLWRDFWETKITLVKSGTALVSIPKDVAEKYLNGCDRMDAVILDAETLRSWLNEIDPKRKFILLAIKEESE